MTDRPDSSRSANFVASCFVFDIVALSSFGLLFVSVKYLRGVGVGKSPATLGNLHFQLLIADY